MTDYPELIYWLALMNESHLKLNVVKPIIQQWCFGEQRTLAQLFELSPWEWATRFGLPDEEANRAVDAVKRLGKQAALVGQWQAQKIEPLIRTDPRYPKRLVATLPAAKQPLILWARGSLSLLQEPGVAVLGSQTPDEATTDLINDVMQTLTAEEINLISGYGRGLDRATFETMLATDGGRAVTVLPMGLGAFAKSTSKLEGSVAQERIVLVSPFAPDTPFQEKLAEARNLLIDHLALALLIPQPDEEAQARGSAALERGLPVFVGLTDTAGNRALIDQGAYLLTDAGEVVEMVQQAMIDTVFSEEETLPAAALPTAPAPAPAPAAPPSTDADYNLPVEEVEPIDSEEALEILSLGGNVPEILRKRLKKEDEDTHPGAGEAKKRGKK
ncbi:MAG: DNA-processing protein DprA [Anaerolineales bacterium]|nr:DNA-processing protein DprA [Anaerolineales bacterium]